NVHHGSRQLDVPHALAPHPAVSHLDTAAVADHSLVFHAAVLAARALPVLFRAEDTLAKQPILFRPIGAIIDGLRLLDLEERPAPDIVRAGKTDPHRAVIIDAIVVGFTGTHPQFSLLWERLTALSHKCK